MPELPEVEAARRALEAHCVGRRITRCAVADDPKVVLSDRVSFERAMVGRTIVAARRRGKNLWLRLDAPPFPSFQFGMSGAIYIKGVAVTKYKRSAVKSTDEWPSKYSKFFVEVLKFITPVGTKRVPGTGSRYDMEVLAHWPGLEAPRGHGIRIAGTNKLDDGLEFSFTDKRRFARVRLFDDPETVPPISELGPDALFEPMSVQNFVDSLSKKKIGIKALLLDQSFISGIGNWIADEVLYQSRTHPLQIASSLTRESCEALHQSIQEVVKYAVDVDADSGRFPIKWLFHHRWGKKPGKVDGKKIEFIKAGGRTTAYVPQLQKLTGTQSGKAVVADPGQVSEDGDAKEAGTEVEEDDDDLKPRKRVAASRAARGQQNKNATNAPSRKTNLVQVSEDGGAKDVGADGDDLKPRKRVATSRAARGKQTKNATSAPSRKTGKNAGGKKKPSVEHPSKDDVETMESDKAGATSNNEHGLDEPTATVHTVSEQGVTRMSSRKKSKPAKYQ